MRPTLGPQWLWTKNQNISFLPQAICPVYFVTETERLTNTPLITWYFLPLPHQHKVQNNDVTGQAEMQI